MSFQACPGVAQIVLKAHLWGQQVRNVLHAECSDPAGTGELQAIADAVHDWVNASYTVFQSFNVGFDAVEVTDLSVAGGQQVIRVFDPESDGDVTDSIKTNQDTFAVGLKTGRSGRSFRGRVYILAVPASSYSNPNTLSTTFVSQAVASLNTLREDLLTAGHPLGILSRFNGGVKRVTGILTVVTTVAASDNIVDSQNRRLPGRGS